MSGYIYIHPRSKSLAHVYAISDRVNYAIAVTKEPWKLIRYLLHRQENAITILSANLDKITVIVLLLCIFKPGKFILHLSSYKTNLIHSSLIKLFLRYKSCKIAFVTKYLQGIVCDNIKCLCNEKSTAVWHSSSIVDSALDIGSELSSRSRQYDFLFFGRLDQERGLEDFLSLARLMPDYTFAVAGKGPLLGLVEQVNSDVENLHYLGYLQNVEEKLNLLMDTKVLVSCMKGTENFGISILEAISCGAKVSVPIDYGPAEILGSKSPFLRDPKTDLDGLRKHMLDVLGTDYVMPIITDLDRFQSKNIAARWQML